MRPAAEKTFVIWPSAVHIINMLRNDLDGEATPDLAKGRARQSALGEVSNSLSPKEPPIRYMDDGTFARCLEEVVAVHDRLLSKLAE